MAEPEDSVELPWHRENWQRILRTSQAGRLPHALLLSGAQGIGKGHFVQRLTAMLLCGSPHEEGRPCGLCKGCNLLRAGTHPDFNRIQPEEPGKAIRIDQIREFTAREALTSQAGGYKILVIEPADSLNMAAANSLLKTLEEPVAWTLMLLVTANPGQLPATIRSRCQRIAFTTPDRQQAIQWLKARETGEDPELLLSLAAGAPLQALSLADSELLQQRSEMLKAFRDVRARRVDPVSVAARWDKLALDTVLNWLCGWTIDMIRLKAAPEHPEIINPDQRETLAAMGRTLEFSRLYDLLDRVYQATGALGSQLNTQMLLEGLLIAWSDDSNRGNRHLW